MSASAWWAAYVGQPWKPTRNCWWLTQHLQLERWQRTMPDLAIAAGQFTWEQWKTLSTLLRDTPWRRLDPKAPPREGDVLVVRGHEGPHVGTFVGEPRPRVLHNCGGIDMTGRPYGSVRCDLLPDLLIAGYTRPEVWRHGS